jgi:hypothetical protein
MYKQYIQGIGQSRLSTADHALLLTSPANVRLDYLYNLDADP